MRAHRFKLTLAAGRVVASVAPHPSAPASRDGTKRKSPSGATRDCGVDRASDCVLEIVRAWSRGATHTIELARVVSAARKQLPYGEWSRLWQSGRMPFSKRKGEMLVVIGERMGWIDAQCFAHLPVAWSTLYWLAHLPRATFEKLIREEVIHPKLTLREARELADRFGGRTTKKTASASNLQRRLDRFESFVTDNVGQWTRAERKLALTALRRWIKFIGWNSGQRGTDRRRIGHSPDARISRGATNGVASLNPKERRMV